MWGRLSRSAALRRWMLRRKIHFSTSKHRSIQSIIGTLGAVGIGTSLYLSNSINDIAAAECRSDFAKNPIVVVGPKIKTIAALSELKREASFQYVILGSGTAAWSVVKTISKNEPEADVLVVSLDATPETGDYQINNPNIDDAYTEWRRHVTATVPEHYGEISPRTKIVVLTGHGDYFVDTGSKQILFSEGSDVKYGKLCIASTGKPRNFQIHDKSKKAELGGEDLEAHLNILDDKAAFQRLEHQLQLVDPSTNSPLHSSVAVVGGGFLGTEIALAALTHGRKIIQVYPEECVLSKYVPSYLSMHLLTLLRKAGVVNLANTLVHDVALERRRSIDMGDGYRHNRVKINFYGDINPLLANYVTLASTYIVPDIRSLRNSYFEIDKGTGGVQVNRYLEVDDDIFAVGNSASYFDMSLGRRRVNTYDHAVKSGQTVGQNMTNKSNKLAPYSFQPGFRSRLTKVGVDACGIGIIDANLKTVGVWCNNIHEVSESTSALNKGIVYYIKQEEDGPEEIVGCLLWNNPDKVDEARTILSSRKTRSFVKLLDLKEKISLGDPSLLNIMVEKKTVPKISELKKKFKADKRR